jgi:pyrimidine oxygenase
MLGIFQPNTYAAQFPTAADGLTEATYESNKRVLLIADEMGLSFALTVARWKGIPGENVGYCTYGFDTYTLTAALLAVTERIAIISTTHTAIWNPVIAAKMGAGLDQIGRGRWGLNIVAGWNDEEFESMGVPLLEHEERYVQATEWLTAVRELWTLGESSFTGTHIALNHAECHPRPLQRGGPVVVNAGISPTGVRFALDHADYMFSFSFQPGNNQLDAERERSDRNPGYIGRKVVIVGETDAAAQEKANEIVERADVLSIVRGPFVRLRDPEYGTTPEAVLREKYAAQPDFIRGSMLNGAVIGSPETVGSELAKWAVETSIDGICLAMLNFEGELELMAQRGLEPLGNALADAGKSLILTVD